MSDGIVCLEDGGVLWLPISETSFPVTFSSARLQSTSIQADIHDGTETEIDLRFVEKITSTRPVVRGVQATKVLVLEKNGNEINSDSRVLVMEVNHWNVSTTRYSDDELMHEVRLSVAGLPMSYSDVLKKRLK